MAIHTQKGTAVEGQCHIFPCKTTGTFCLACREQYLLCCGGLLGKLRGDGSDPACKDESLLNQQLPLLKQGSHFVVALEEAVRLNSLFSLIMFNLMLNIDVYQYMP